MIVLCIILYLVGWLITFGIVFALTNYDYEQWFNEEDKDILALLMFGFFLAWPGVFIMIFIILIGRVLFKLALATGIFVQIIFNRKKNKEMTV